MNRRELMANVARGVKLLDEKDPLWWNGGDSDPVIEGMVGHIDLEQLDLLSPISCVLGQRHDSAFEGGVKALSLYNNIPEQVRHGFEAQGPERRKDASILTELWASVIQSRRFPRRKIARDPWIVKVNKTWVREVPS